MNAVKEVALVEQSAETASVLSIVERLAANPNVDVVKLEKMIELQERLLAHQAKAAFNSAYSRLQRDLPVITEQGEIEVKGTVRATYAKLEDIHDVVKPICQQHGFAIRHRTEWPENKPNIIRVVGILSHEGGHSEESAFEAPLDRSDYRSDIQSMGSTVSYGRRYTTLDLLNIATRGADNNGAKKAPVPPKAPDGFDRWREDLFAAADEGWQALAAAVEASKKEYREHLKATEPATMNVLKEKARTADKRKAVTP